MNFSVQLYSLRREIESEGLDRVLSTVRAAGFDAVELAGTCGLSNAELKKRVYGNGLSVSGAHVAYETLTDRLDEAVCLAADLGFTDVIVPYIPEPFFWEQAQALAEGLNKIQARLSRYGLTLGYHTHDVAFARGDGLKELIARVPALRLEIDISGLKAAGYAVLPYLQQMQSRLMALHVQELSAAGSKGQNPVVGQGVADCADALQFAATQGHPYAVLKTEVMCLPYAAYLKKSCTFMKNTIKEDING